MNYVLDYLKKDGVPKLSEYLQVNYLGDYENFAELLAADPEEAMELIDLVVTGELMDDTQEQAFVRMSGKGRLVN